MGEIVVGLDIGSHKICTIIGEVRDDDLYVIGLGVVPSRGLHKGVVDNIQDLASSIAQSVNLAEQTSGYDISRAYVSASTTSITSLTSRGVVGISEQRGIRNTDLDRAMENASHIAIPHNQEVLHVVPRSYTLDGQESIRNPIGLHCFRLEVDAHILTASSTNLANIEQAVGQAGLTVDRFILNPFAAGDAVLDEAEKEAGVVLVDIGARSTGVGIFVEGTLWYSAVLPIGGAYITQDIMYWSNAPFEVAERIKLQHGHAMEKSVNALQTFEMERFGDQAPRKVSRKELAMVIEARSEEILEFVKKSIKRSGYDALLPAGVVLTGGTAQLHGLQDLAQQTLNMPVRTTHPQDLVGMADKLRTPAFSASVGLLRLGLQMEYGAESTYQSTSANTGNIGNLIGGLVRRLLPDEGR